MHARRTHSLGLPVPLLCAHGRATKCLSVQLIKIPHSHSHTPSWWWAHTPGTADAAAVLRCCLGGPVVVKLKCQFTHCRVASRRRSADKWFPRSVVCGTRATTAAAAAYKYDYDCNKHGGDNVVLAASRDKTVRRVCVCGFLQEYIYKTKKYDANRHTIRV